MITKHLSKILSAAAFVAFFLTPSMMQAQVSKVETAVVKDGYVMMDGEMMQLKDGKFMLMKKKQKMANGTVIKKNGTVVMADGQRSKMKNGNCIDNTGKIEDCKVNSQSYTCTHHKDVRSAKAGKCPQCGMDLVEKNRSGKKKDKKKNA